MVETQNLLMLESVSAALSLSTATPSLSCPTPSYIRTCKTIRLWIANFAMMCERRRSPWYLVAGSWAGEEGGK